MRRLVAYWRKFGLNRSLSAKEVLSFTKWLTNCTERSIYKAEKCSYPSIDHNTQPFLSMYVPFLLNVFFLLTSGGSHWCELAYKLFFAASDKGQKDRLGTNPDQSWPHILVRSGLGHPFRLTKWSYLWALTGRTIENPGYPSSWGMMDGPCSHKHTQTKQ